MRSPASHQTDGDRVAGPQGHALAVPHPVVPGAAAAWFAVCALGQRLRRVADHVATTAGATNGQRVRQWFQDKKAGWYTVLADPRMPVSSTWLDQAHHAIDRKLFMMKGFHHPKGSQQAFLPRAGASV